VRPNPGAVSRSTASSPTAYCPPSAQPNCRCSRLTGWPASRPSCWRGSLKACGERMHLPFPAAAHNRTPPRGPLVSARGVARSRRSIFRSHNIAGCRKAVLSVIEVSRAGLLAHTRPDMWSHLPLRCRSRNSSACCSSRRRPPPQLARVCLRCRSRASVTKPACPSTVCFHATRTCPPDMPNCRELASRSGTYPAPAIRLLFPPTSTRRCR
jgi:hypothetical protein